MAEAGHDGFRAVKVSLRRKGGAVFG